jgi:hypothetical protein
MQLRQQLSAGKTPDWGVFLSMVAWVQGNIIIRHLGGRSVKPSLLSLFLRSIASA